jgi:serine/threonine-protein kinase RsbW
MPAKEPEVIRLRMPSRLELLSVVDALATSLCSRMDFDADTTSQVTTSVIEAGTNAIQHGHQRNASLPVDMTFTLFGDRLEVEVVDTGPGFDPDALNGDVTSPEHLFDARGRGIFIMRTCMDEVDFRFTPSGTICHLVKRRPATGSAG